MLSLDSQHGAERAAGSVDGIDLLVPRFCALAEVHSRSPNISLVSCQALFPRYARRRKGA